MPVSENHDTSKFAPRKAYVVIRSEGGPDNVQRVRNILAADFSENNVQTQYSLYRAKQAWNQDEIFNTAYEGLYDYIILIDQVAKFTIDNKTQVGAKYQIRSYHIKSPKPDWLDLGQSTCNLSVVPSVQKFSREVIRSIVGNQATFIGHDLEYDEAVVSNTNSSIESDSKPSKDMSSEIEILRKELEEEKKRSRLAEEERRRLENQLKLEVEAQKQRARIAQIEAEDIALKKRQRQREIAEAYAAKRETIKKREAEEALKEPVVVVESKAKAPTREELRSQREETKKRQAEEREAKRQEIAAAAAAKKEERKRLVELEREEKRRLKEELEAERKKKERLAEEDLQRIREKVAEERRMAEELDRQEKEAKRLAEERKEEEKRQAIIREAELKEQERLEKEKAEALVIEERNARRIAREEEAKRQEALLQAQRQEEKRQAELKLAELERQDQERKMATTKDKSSKKGREKASNEVVLIPNVFVVIRGKEEDKKKFEDLEDHIEFDLMFAKAKSETIIFNLDQSVALSEILQKASTDHNILFLIDQKEYLGDGKYMYEIKTLKRHSESDWTSLSSQAFNLANRPDLKQLSKKITVQLSN